MSELENARRLVLAETSEDAARRGATIEKWLDIELGGSGSLNARGTTLASLSAATIALTANASAAWLEPKWNHSGLVQGSLKGLLGVGLLLLGASVGSALKAVWPHSQWRVQLSELLTLLAVSGPSSQNIEGVTLEILECQRAKNEQKSRYMRWAYLLMGSGVAFVILAAILFAVAQ